jgi:CHAT domain-containing protein
MLQLARAYQALGQYRQAFQSLSQVQQHATATGDRRLMAAVARGLGDAYIAVGQIEEATQALQQGLNWARAVGEADLTAAVLHDLGNALALQGNHTEAWRTYTESLALTQHTNNHALAVRTLINMAGVARQQGQPLDTRQRLAQAMVQMRDVPTSHEKAYGLIKIGLISSELRADLPAAHDDLLLHAAHAFQAAAEVAQALDDARALSYAWGYLGALYEEEARYPEALQLTRQALLAAQRLPAPESLYRWQWQTGRLLKAQGDLEAAIVAYQHAMNTLQSFRHERVPGHNSQRASFRDTVGPLYFGLVDLLLQRAATLHEPALAEASLRQAQEIVELFKAVELREYFQDDCVDAARARVTRLDEVVAQTTVVIYPIPLPQRLELLVRTPSGLQRFAVPVGADTLTHTVRELRLALEKRTTRQYLGLAQKLYDWMLRPLEPVLAPLQIDTLVFVPDGALRTVPMAVLHDGQQFLIDKYAVATTPSLHLTDPRPLQRADPKVLVAALTEGVQGFAPLPHIASELTAIQQLYPGHMLVNQEFRIANVAQALQTTPFSIVHIASHGQFASTVEQTFLLAFDDKLTLGRLSELIGRQRFRDEPLELLTLSACQTAAGDDRAALGLAGVAIKAGARSALATLWSINDEAASDLVAEFYRQLQKPTVSRAVALQRAQRTLRSDQRYQHPYYWSPFLLLNNWL